MKWVAGVSAWKKGQRVGVGWHGGQDNTCRECRRGDFRNCQNLKIPGISYDGGYQQYMVAPVEALAAIPESLKDVDAAPLLCAGITTYNALRHSGALPGDLVAVQGIGGLGHLGIQFANKFGYKVAAIGRGSENAALAKKLGATVYIDSGATNAAEELQKLGGAQVILATAPSSKAMSELIDGLGPNGKLMVIGATFDPIEVTPLQLISRSRTIQGWAAGTAADSEDTLRFAELSGVRPMIETYPLEKAAEALRAHDERQRTVSRRSDDVRFATTTDTASTGCTNSHKLSYAFFQITPLDPVLAGFLHGLSSFCDARIISIAVPDAGKGTSHGTPDFLSHDTGRWALHLLPRGRPERRADDSPAARTSLFVANVRAALRPAFRSLSPGRARLPRLRTQRLAGSEKIRVYLRSLSPRS